MKRIIILLSALISLSVLSSCMPELKPPYGLWECKEPSILLFIEPEYQPFGSYHHGEYYYRHVYTGLYNVDGNEIKIFAEMNPAPNGNGITIFEATSFLEVKNRVLEREWFFAGEYKMVRNKMHYKYRETLEHRKPNKTIIFHKLEDYEPPTLVEWFSEEEFTPEALSGWDIQALKVKEP